VRGTARTELRPWGFFVAWDGVLTMVYRGFPRPLTDLKQHISRHFPELLPGWRASTHSTTVPCSGLAPSLGAQLTRSVECREPGQQVAKDHAGCAG
jgi:hypothetical protein